MQILKMFFLILNQIQSNLDNLKLVNQDNSIIGTKIKIFSCFRLKLYKNLINPNFRMRTLKIGNKDKKWFLKQDL